MSDIPEQHRIDDETVDGYIEQLRKIVDRSQRLEYGPGGIMEMKQTIAKLERYRDFVWSFYNEPMEMSYEKIPIQYAHWKRSAGKLMSNVEGE